MKVTALIEKNENNYFMISSKDKIGCCSLGGYGYSVEEAKKDFYTSIEEAKEIAKEEGIQFEESVDVEFKYDIPSFFDCFGWINVSRFAKEAGINESKMRQYKVGAASASENTTKKILNTIHSMADKLRTVTIQ